MLALVGLFGGIAFLFGGGLSLFEQPPRPGESLATLCKAGDALVQAVALEREAIDAAGAGDQRTAGAAATRAEQLVMDATGTVGYAGFMEGRTEPPTPGFDALSSAIQAAIDPVREVVAVIRPPQAPVAVEARPRLLARAEAAVEAIDLPASCPTILSPAP